MVPKGLGWGKEREWLLTCKGDESEWWIFLELDSSDSCTILRIW